MKSDSIKVISEQLLKANSILLYPHVLMDGDTLGSAVALCKALRGMGKDAHVLIEDDIPKYLTFLDKGYCTHNQEIIREPDLCVCIDCADISRFILRKEAFLRGKTTMCIDHHITSTPFADYNYIDALAAATAEIVYELICDMDVSIDKDMGEALYAAITTDTGNFQYSNTSAKTHLIAVELFKIGIDHSYVSCELYQNVALQKLRISHQVLGTIKMLMNGKVAIAYVTKSMLKEAGAIMEDTEGIVETLRNISGVELSVFAKEDGENQTKISMRSKRLVNVSEITSKYNGGGHIRAAGCTINEPLIKAMGMIEADIIDYFTEQGISDD